jgi:hypothetical protein
MLCRLNETYSVLCSGIFTLSILFGLNIHLLSYNLQYSFQEHPKPLKLSHENHESLDSRTLNESLSGVYLYIKPLSKNLHPLL